MRGCDKCGVVSLGSLGRPEQYAWSVGRFACFLYSGRKLHLRDAHSRYIGQNSAMQV